MRVQERLGFSYLSRSPDRMDSILHNVIDDQYVFICFHGARMVQVAKVPSEKPLPGE